MVLVKSGGSDKKEGSRSMLEGTVGSCRRIGSEALDLEQLVGPFARIAGWQFVWRRGSS